MPGFLVDLGIARLEYSPVTSDFLNPQSTGQHFMTILQCAVCGIQIRGRSGSGGGSCPKCSLLAEGGPNCYYCQPGNWACSAKNQTEMHRTKNYSLCPKYEHLFR